MSVARFDNSLVPQSGDLIFIVRVASDGTKTTGNCTFDELKQFLESEISNAAAVIASADDITQAAEDATAAKEAAVAAQTAAEAAKDSAATAKEGAETAQGLAEEAATTAAGSAWIVSKDSKNYKIAPVYDGMPILKVTEV
jgi:hypothetical protein